MPSSSKYVHHTRQSPPFRSTAAITISLVIGISGFIFGLATLLSTSSTHNCTRAHAPMRTVRVVSDGENGAVVVGDGGEVVKRRKVMGFVGIQTGFGSGGRRRALRMTWMPSDRIGLQRLEESTGLAFRFIIGRTTDKAKMVELNNEIAEYDDFLLIDTEEKYSLLPYKTLAFFKSAYALFDADFYVKADDDIYLRPDRLSLLLAKERTNTQTYIGCLKKGPVFTDPKLKWYEPLSNLLGKEYFLHAYGPIYALSAVVVANLGTLRNNSFRMFSNEDVTIGAWMLAMNVHHEHNQALCESECSPSSIAVWDIPKCSGLCDPETKLLELHQKDSCSKSPTMASDE